MRLDAGKFCGGNRPGVSLSFTMEQFLEYDGGLMDFSWYNILQTMMTHVHTVQTLEASGRYWL